MTTLTTMLTSRDAAGTRYANALAELRAAYIDLAAIDKALTNRHVGARTHIATFDGTQAQEGVPVGLRHPDYAASADGAWHKEIDAQEQVYLSDLKAG